MSKTGNVIERRGNKVVKKFASRINFVKESNIYEKLKGSGLAPEMYGALDGEIELEYVEGPNFYQNYLAAGTDPAAQVKCFEDFYRWYMKYREITNIGIGDMDFEDFIALDTGLKAIDFEHCKPCSMEEDIAYLACLIAMYPHGYTTAGMESAKLFVCVGSSCMNWQADTLSRVTPLAAERVEKQLGLRRNVGMAHYLAAYFSTTGVVLAGGKSSRMKQDKKQMMVDGKTMLEASANLIGFMPKRIISAAAGEDINFPGFETVNDSYTNRGPMEGIVSCLKSSNQPWTLFLTCDMPLLTDKLLRLFLSYPKDEADAFMFTAGGKRQTFPLLLRTENASRAMQDAVVNNEYAVQLAIERRLKIKTINAEDFGDFVPNMLWNINTPEDYEKITK